MGLFDASPGTTLRGPGFLHLLSSSNPPRRSETSWSFSSAGDGPVARLVIKQVGFDRSVAQYLDAVPPPTPHGYRETEAAQGGSISTRN